MKIFSARLEGEFCAMESGNSCCFPANVSAGLNLFSDLYFEGGQAR